MGIGDWVWGINYFDQNSGFGGRVWGIGMKKPNTQHPIPHTLLGGNPPDRVWVIRSATSDVLVS